MLDLALHRDAEQCDEVHDQDGKCAREDKAKAGSEVDAK